MLEFIDKVVLISLCKKIIKIYKKYSNPKSSFVRNWVKRNKDKYNDKFYNSNKNYKYIDAMLISLSYHNLIAIEYKNQNSNIITDIIEINNEVEKRFGEDFDDSDFEIM
ncbi:hypothetical protein EPJ64_04225 [Brachyspira aalborgi]|jgi:hypothetical protein|uniref:Uncharacterized protein n=1 Tax=Brachyspira aalborgi TaxID=29522 RepID=A0AB38PYX1_9SPIR|nr:hypothetical protein [Brachyspira aalborgi]TXJ15841.1 hypothetical protein EPJ77_04240 [Brachyspira aalborgi]TXJ19342.1 hypothetical protein EPJ64_04225 [Brachyspira aalborgi]TXJ26096.1 hypothetical protein EPJ73_04600 [Brachyspira aalborgi]TXJ48646.1 hypothetical protein EPJ75_04515 [Brachyspira aalborgi]